MLGRSQRAFVFPYLFPPFPSKKFHIVIFVLPLQDFFFLAFLNISFILFYCFVVLGTLFCTVIYTYLTHSGTTLSFILCIFLS